MQGKVSPMVKNFERSAGTATSPEKLAEVVPFRQKEGVSWLAIEVTKCAQGLSWKLEITTDKHKTITWPDHFETPERAFEVAKEVICFCEKANFNFLDRRSHAPDLKPLC